MWGLLRDTSRQCRTAALAAVAAFLVVPGLVIVNMLRDASMRLDRQGPYAALVRRQSAVLSAAKWIRENTPTDALFYCALRGDNRFRLYSARGQVYAWKDGGPLAMECHPKLGEWLRRQRAVEDAVQAGDIVTLHRLVTGWGARYWVCDGPQDALLGLGATLVYAREGWVVYSL